MHCKPVILLVIVLLLECWQLSELLVSPKTKLHLSNGSYSLDAPAIKFIITITAIIININIVIIVLADDDDV